MTSDKILVEKIAELEKLLKIQTANGNWNYDRYMHGMANGMLIALSVLTGTDPEFLDPPKMFISDHKMLDKFNNSSIIVDNIRKSTDNETD